jgi:hypothetical protein
MDSQYVCTGGPTVDRFKASIQFYGSFELFCQPRWHTVGSFRDVEPLVALTEQFKRHRLSAYHQEEIQCRLLSGFEAKFAT